MPWWFPTPALSAVMAGLVPAIHVFAFDRDFKDVDARHKAGHDENLGPHPGARNDATVIPGR